MKKTVESNRLYLKNNGFEYSEEYNAYYRTYGNNDKPIYIKEHELDMPIKKFDLLVEERRLQAIKFQNITPSDLLELDKTMEKVNRIAKQRAQEETQRQENQNQIQRIDSMTVEDLQKLKNEVEQALREKGIKRTRKPKALDKRKPSLRIRKSIYLEMYYRDETGKVVCKYLGKIGDTDTEKKLESIGKPELLDEYWKLKIGLTT